MDWQLILTIVGSIIVPMFGLMGWFYSRIDKRFDKIDQKFEKLETKFESRFDRVERDITELRTSLNRIEGAFYSKDCCMLKEDKHKKAE